MESEVSSLIINNSAKRFIRAGSSNMVLPIFVILIVLIAHVGTLPLPARLMMIGFLLLTATIGVRMYLRTLARVDFLDNRLELVLAVWKREVPYDTIQSVQLVRFRFNPLLRIRIKLKSSLFGVQFLVRGPFTPWGSLKECSARFAEEFQAKGIQVIEQ
jgi:hypothetical protein